MMTHVINLLMSFAILAPFIVAFSLYRSVFGYFNFALAALYTCGLYFLALSPEDIQGSILRLLFLLVSISVLFVSQKIIFEPMQSKKATEGQLLVVSLGVYIVIEQILSVIFGERIIFPDATSSEISGSMIILSSLSLVFLTTWGLMKTEFGARIQAVIESPSLSRIVGLRVSSIKLRAFFIIIVLTCFSGILASSETGAFPRAGFNPAILAFAVALLGGAPLGRKFFCYLIGVICLQYFSIYVFSASWSATIVYSVLLGSLIVSSRMNKVF